MMMTVVVNGAWNMSQINPADVAILIYSFEMT